MFIKEWLYFVENIDFINFNCKKKICSVIFIKRKKSLVKLAYLHIYNYIINNNLHSLFSSFFQFNSFFAVNVNFILIYIIFIYIIIYFTDLDLSTCDLDPSACALYLSACALDLSACSSKKKESSVIYRDIWRQLSW